MLKVESLYVSFTKEYYTLNNISFELGNNQKLIVVGSKESGRTVLLRVLLGLEPIAKGDVYFKDISISKLDFQNDVSVGYIPVTPTFLEKKSVEDNIEYVVKLREKDKSYIAPKVNNALVEYGLEYIRKKKVKELSYYDKMKLALARLSTRSIDVLLIDDVFTNLSSMEREKFIKQIKSLVKSQVCTTLIMVENDDVADMFGYNKKYLVYGSLQDSPNVNIDEL
jgi:branched-chain amino acid transport system ATP-binding protein